MEPITTTVIVTYVATNFLDQFVAEEGYGWVREFFFPKETYRRELEKVIYSTIEEFEKTHPPTSIPGKFPFYHSKILFSQLMELTYFKGVIANDLEEKFEQNPQIIIPTKNELKRFFDVFQKNVTQNDSLRELYINEYYKSEIFAISELLSTNSETLNDLDHNVSKLLIKHDETEKPSVTASYIDRVEEEELIKEIKSNNILLLTGISFCGKSQIAKRICQKLIENGYEYKSRSDINEAERYLRPTGKKRVFLLEDPFGHIPDSYSNDDWRTLEELIRNIPEDNKLIVTSRIEVLRSLNDIGSIDELSIDEHKWYDLTITNTSFLISFWNEASLRNKLLDSTKKQIRDYLIQVKNEKDLLQVGHLNHLSNIESNKLVEKDTEYLIYLARTDSKRISKEIKKRGNIARRIFIALGLGASTNIPIKMKELEYALSGANERPGFIAEEKFQSFTGSDFLSKNDPSNFPQYNLDVKISDEELMELSFLQERGYIEIHNKNIFFKHPTYHEAARYLFFEADIYNQKLFKDATEKLLSSLNPTTSKHCASQLSFIYNNTVVVELKKNIQELALRSASESIFPGTRDICFTFLLNIFGKLHSSHREYLLKKLEQPITAHDIQWLRDIPFIDSTKVNFHTGTLEGFKKEDVPTILTKIREDKNVSLREIWNFITHITNTEKLTTLTSNEILKLLDLDESFIRSRISSNIFKKSYPGSDIVKAIFTDKHPSVIFEGLKGALLGYQNFSTKDKKELLSFLTRSLENTYVKVRANNLLSTFGIDYGSESYNWRNIGEEQKLQMWSLWAKLFPILLNNYPENLEFSNTGRFHSTLRDSTKVLTPQQGFEISESFYLWISKFIHRRVLDEFELSVMSYLLDVTDRDKTIRFKLFKEILSHEDTGFVALSLADSIERWNKLTTSEKEYIILLLSGNRNDSRWLQAISLTQNIVPKEILNTLFNDENIFHQDTSIVVKSFDDQLLSDCLSIFFGKPQPLWWLGFHHRGVDFWYNITKWILRNEYTIGFDICLRELVSDGVNNSSAFTKVEGYQTWSFLCQNGTEKIRLAERLIIETSTTACSINSTKKLWDILIKGFEEDGKIDELIDLIVENISFLQSNNPEDLTKFFGIDFIIKRILPKLSLDYEIITFVIKVKDKSFSSKNDIKFALESILKQRKKFSIHLQITHNAINNIISDKINEMPFLGKLQDLYSDVNKNGKSRLNQTGENYELENWNYCFGK